MTDTEDGRWLSYTELAAERGISRASAIRMVRRQRWRRQEGNDGEARVLVPADALPGVRTDGSDTGQTPDIPPGTLAVLEAAVATLGEQLDVANTRAERAEARADDLRAQIDAQRTAIDELKAGQTLITEMHARELAVAQHDAQAARDATDALRQTDADRKARGLVARLRSAWRGE